jgi:uncharacterized protein
MKKRFKKKNVALRLFAWALAISLIGGTLILNVLIIHENRSEPTLVFGRQNFKLIVASTPSEIEKGLGGRQSLPLNQGMLFYLRNTDYQCFWMKDMSFPIDIIWVNSEKQVTTITPNVSPNTYPHVFCPSANSLYVIELNAGVTSRAGISEGQTLRF